MEKFTQLEKVYTTAGRDGCDKFQVWTIHLELLEIDLPTSGFIFLISGSVICGKFPVEYIHKVFEIMDD